MICIPPASLQLMKIIKIPIIKVRNILLSEQRSIFTATQKDLCLCLKLLIIPCFFFLLLLGEMGYQYINTDERTTTNVFKFQKIYIFSNMYVKWGMWGGGAYAKNRKTLMTYRSLTWLLSN